MRTRTEEVLLLVKEERERQDAKWGEQNHPDWTPNPLGVNPVIDPARHAKGVCDEKFKAGQGSYSDILLEEVAEAHDEAKAGNVDALYTELVQVAAVAVEWIEAIDRRERADD